VACGSIAGSGLLHRRAKGEEGGCEVVFRPAECVAGVSNRVGDEFRSLQIFLEGFDERGVLFGLFRYLIVASESSTKSYLNDDKGACLPIEGGRIRGGGV